MRRRLVISLLFLCCMVGSAEGALRRIAGPVIQMTAPGHFATLQLGRSIAARPDGTFVTTWSQQSIVYFTLHDAAGTPGIATNVGVGEIATVAVDGAGNFVIAWAGYEGDNSYGIYAQRYTVAGVATGPQLHVNEYTPDHQTLPAVAMNAGGEFVVVWQSSGQEGTYYEVYARRFDEFSVPQGGEFRVNETAANLQVFPSVALRDDGSFIVTWANQTNALAPLGIELRRFDASGNALAGDELIHNLDASTAPVEILPDGGFAIAYLSGTHGWVQRYTAAGVKNGAATYIAQGIHEIRLDVNAAGKMAVSFDPQRRMLVSLLNPDGTIAVAAADLTPAETSTRYNPWVALKPNGDVVMSWSPAVFSAYRFEVRQLSIRRAIRFDVDGDATGDVFLRRDDLKVSWEMRNLSVRTSKDWYGPGFDPVGPYYIGDTNTQGVIYQHRTTGAIKGSQCCGDTVIATPPAGWQGRGTGDFDGDTRTDLILQNQFTGEVAIWLLAADQKIRAGAIIASVPLPWQIRGAGDVNADGKDDVILQHQTSREVAIWRIDAFVIVAGAIIASPAAGWNVRTTGDFNGDGRNDIALQNTITHEIAVWLMNDFTITGAGVVAAVSKWWQLGGATDANADGRDDLILGNINDFQHAAWAMNGTTIQQGRIIGVAPGWELAMQAPNP